MSYTIKEQNDMLGVAPDSWLSSNLREWLNSDMFKVNYTGTAPSYADEPGFLSDQNFTQSERDGIAVTRHSGKNIYSMNANISKTEYISLRGVSSIDYQYNDKVFILNFNELENYIEKNNRLMEMNRKHYSNHLQKETNMLDKYDYLVNAGHNHSTMIGWKSMFGSTVERISASSGHLIYNIVPALSLYPDFVFSNGTRASDIRIGSTVYFGKYMNEPIEWIVINKTDDGYPLLWSSRILTRKRYDDKGVLKPKTSNYINFTEYDVDLVSDPQPKSWETQKLIDSSPAIKLDNESKLLTPTNDTSITVNLTAEDSKYGIRRIVTPDGKIINGSSYKWTITSNGQYTFYAENGIGVITPRHFVTKAINVPARLEVVLDTETNGKWAAKQTVIATVRSSHDDVYKTTMPAKDNLGWNSNSGTRYPEWLPLGGKTLHIKGKFKNAMSDADVEKVPTMNVELRVRFPSQYYSIDRVQQSYPAPIIITLDELKKSGEIVIDHMYKIPDNSYGSFYPQIHYHENSNYRQVPYNYSHGEFAFEIQEQDDFKIQEIILPDGSRIKGSNATYTVSKPGVYEFIAVDNRGQTSSEIIELDMDTDMPTLQVKNTTPETTRTAVLSIEATDATSGIQRIVLPNGESRTNSEEHKNLSLEYNITANGTYVFDAYDWAGNRTRQSIVVTNIYRTLPQVNITPSTTSWTNKDVILTIKASSDLPIKSIRLPDGSVVNKDSATYVASSNQDCTFVIEDIIGNVRTETYTVSNIDKDPPIVFLSLDTTKPVANPVTLMIEASSVSGIKEIKINGVSVKGNPKVIENGIYVVSVTDNAGNTTVKEITVSNILEGFNTQLSLARTIKQARVGDLKNTTPRSFLSIFNTKHTDHPNRSLRVGEVVRNLRLYFFNN